MNRNYQAGVRFERLRKKHYESLGYTVLRTAGSHGFADLVVINGGSVYFVQCKRVELLSQANRLLKAFREQPESPLNLILDIYVKDGRQLITEHN